MIKSAKYDPKPNLVMIGSEELLREYAKYMTYDNFIFSRTLMGARLNILEYLVRRLKRFLRKMALTT